MDCKKIETLTFPFMILILGITHYWSGLVRIPWSIMRYMSLEEVI